MRQVVFNLIQNAVEASPAHGTVDVTAWSENGAFHLSVLDHGPGVPVAMRERIFEDFYSTKTGLRTAGMGLGLSIVRRSLRALRGEIDIAGAPAIMGSQGAVGGSEVVLEDGQRLPLREEFERALSDADREQFFPLGLRDPYAIQQLDWLRSIERGTDPETSGREGLRDLACAFAILESSALGRQVSMDEILDGSVDGYQREIDEHYDLIS